MIKINGQVVNEKQKVKIHRKFSEEHDAGEITVEGTRETRYEIYSPVDYTNGSVEEQMLVEKDNVVKLNSTEYRHELTLVENKAKFDGIYPFDRSFTKIDQTLSDILTVYKRELQEYHGILIDWSLTTAQEDQVITFKEYSGVNLSTILVSLFRSIDAIPYVVRDGNTWEINARPYNERGSLISGSSTTQSLIQSRTDYATKVKSQLKNAVNERAQVDVEWFPSESGYVLSKSAKPIKATSDLEYQLPSPIVKMLEVIAVDVPYKYADGDGVFFYDTANVDITSQVVQSEVYDTLDIINSTSPLVIALTNNAKNNVKYDLYGNKVYDLFEASTDKRFFIGIDTPYLLNAIIRVLKPLVDAVTGRTFAELEDNTGTDVETEDIKLRFKYVKQRNIDLVAHRKTKGEMNTTTVIHNQRDSSVEISQYKKALKNYSNRQGNDYFSKSKLFGSGETPHSIADFLADGKVVVETIKTYQGNNIFCDWVEIDNFANLESEYALSKRPEPFTINDKTVQTNVVSEEFVWFSETDVGIDTRLTDFGQEGLLGLFALTSVSGFEKVHSAVFKPDLTGWDSTKAISMELDNDGDGNLLTFHAFFDHQLLAGNIYYDVDTDTPTTDFRPLKYTDDNGELEDFQLYLVSDTDFLDGGEYPLITDETDYLTNKLTANGTSEPLDLDINAAFAFTYNISFVADNNMFVGEFLAKNNYLISDQQDTHTIVIYKSTKPYTMYDQVPRTADTVANVSYVYDFTNRNITFTANESVDYFCFTKNGKILLAINKSLTATENYTVYINILKTLEDFTTYSISASADDLATLTATALLAYTSRIYPISASASDLSSLSATGILLYTSLDYDLSANATDLASLTGTALLEYSDISYNFQANATDLASLSGSGVLEYTRIEYVLDANATNIANLTGTINLEFTGVVMLSANGTDIANITGTGVLAYTDRTYVLEANGTNIAGLSGTADLSYAEQNYSLSATGTSIADFTGTCDITYTYLAWVYIGTSAPPQDQTVTFDPQDDVCRTSSEVQSLLTSISPPTLYAEDFIMKADHSRTIELPPFPPTEEDCTSYYYRNTEVAV